VSDLKASEGVVFLDEFDDALEVGDVFVLPETVVKGRDASNGTHSGGFEYDQGSTTDGVLTQVNQVPVAHEPVIGGVLAHGRDHDSVLKGSVLDADRREQLRLVNVTSNGFSRTL